MTKPRAELRETHEFTFRFPVASAPAFAAFLPRWEQMDPVSRAVTEAWCAWFGLPGQEVCEAAKPQALLVATPSASNLADWDFAGTGAFSPQKFVATLPSVAMQPLLQAFGMVLPVLCVQKGEETLSAALEEAELLVASGLGSVGILSVDPGDLTAPGGARSIQVRYAFLGGGTPA